MDFEMLKNRITEAAQSGVAKAKELSEIAKLKVNIATEKDAIRKAEMELGKLYYAEHGADPDPAYASLCLKINECKERIAYNDERIADIRRSGNITDADMDSIHIDADDVDDI